MPHGFHDVARARFALRANHGRAFPNAPQGFAQVARAANKRHAVIVLPNVVFFIGGGQHFALVNEVHFQCLQNIRFGKMADAYFGHHGDGYRVHNFANDFDRCHARHAALFADVRRHALQRHHGACSGVLGNFGLLRVRDVHDHAAFEHLRKADFHTPLIRAFAAIAMAIWFLYFHFSSPLPLETF